MTLPVLETPRLRLRPRVLSDLEDCLAMDREPGTLDWIEWPEAAGGWNDEAAHRAFIRARIETVYPDGMGYWVIARRERPAEFLGWVLLIPADGRGPDVEIGWRLTLAARGRGFATEAARRVLDHGLTIGLDRVIADIHPGNAASIRVARKIGMRDAGPPPGLHGCRPASSASSPRARAASAPSREPPPRMRQAQACTGPIRTIIRYETRKRD